MNPIKQLGEIIKSLRNEKSLTQAQLSELAKVSVKQISKMENGHGDVSIIALGRVFRALGNPARLVLYENPSPSDDPFWDVSKNMESLVKFKADVDARRGIRSEVDIDKILSIDL